MIKKLTNIPGIPDPEGEKKALEWQIPDRVSAALMFTKETGHSFIAKVRIEKKHWWSRPWETYITHAPDRAEALKKGLEFLEGHGYSIDPGTIPPEKY